MTQKLSKKAWVAILKGSILPLIIGVLVFTLFWRIYEIYNLGRKVYLDKIFASLLILFITYWVFKIAVVLFNWYAENIASKTKTKLDDKFIPLFKRVAITIIWTLGLIILLSKIGVNVNALVATLGVSSLAIALAAQDTISNIICGFLIMLDRPFSVGDTIKLPSGEKVKVLDIGIRRSKFISEDNAIIIVPNLDLSKNKVINYSYAEEIKSDIQI